MSSASPEEAIHVNAELVVDRFRSPSGLGANFGYNRESIAWIEQCLGAASSRSIVEVKPS
jgi:hypothetical protein